MEKFRIDNFLEAEPGKVFPYFESVPPDVCRELKARLAQKLKLRRESDALIVLEAAVSKVQVLEGLSAEDRLFDLQGVLRRVSAVQPHDFVYINWDRFEHIDRMRVADLSQHFFYIWYSGPDDIELFDDNLSWLMSIHHSGTVSVGRLEPWTMSR